MLTPKSELCHHASLAASRHNIAIDGVKNITLIHYMQDVVDAPPLHVLAEEPLCMSMDTCESLDAVSSQEAPTLGPCIASSAWRRCAS
ncbi:hypothetical protein A0H81_14573 [Grifola frondosa]|uniref:Uncharacterized protein n=1 Tax=Grifola frondosa TaxID=5627 RepID=A0A1C7LL22_GRIFR|nr:hypothetical protein A0H81_14573 [Grifola frondosa]